MTLRRIVPAAAATFLVLLCGALYLLGYCEQYATLLSSLGAAPFRFPFLDTHAVLAAVQCHRQGIDVYTENPCDVFGRIHVYSPLWLALSALPITTDWTPAVGATLVGLFLLSLTLLPPGRGWAQVGIITLATLSGSVAFALERANNDLVIFILAALIIRLRWCGYALAVLAAMLKFYPAVLLALAVRERLWLFAAIGAAAAAALTGFAALYSHDLMRVLPSIPTTSYFDAYAFGARNLPFGLAETFGLPRGAAMALFGLFALILLVSAIMIVRRSGLTIRMDILSGLETASLLAGCVLVLACFFTAQNVLYRGVHFLFVVPGLTVLARRPGSGMARAFVALVLVLMFWELLRRHMDPALAALGVPPPDIHAIDFNVWLIRELFWWCAATGLVTLFLALLMRSRAADELRSVTRFFWKSRRISCTKASNAPRAHGPASVPVDCRGSRRSASAHPLGVLRSGNPECGTCNPSAGAAAGVDCDGRERPGGRGRAGASVAMDNQCGRPWPVLRQQAGGDCGGAGIAGQGRAVDRCRLHAGQPDASPQCVRVVG